MKRVLCLLLCMMMIVPFAAAETADTLLKKFARQLTGGNGVRGYMSLTASGVADWLSYLLPFTASDIQIRAIGQKQGERSENILDDDEWQIKFYTENSAKEEVGTTWLYGDPKGVYFQSELLPDTVMTIPVEKTHLLYQIFRGEWSDLFFAFDFMDMQDPGANGNTTAYSAVANILGIPTEEWETEWLPVLENYFLQLDLWLASYGDPTYVNGKEAGSLKMTANYTIPVKAIKQEAKYILGQMLFDYELQNLLMSYVSMDQRVLYLNPTMFYFYEACIDALPLEGDVVFSREMSSMGKVVSTMISLPLPQLPDNLTAPVNELVAQIFGLEDVEVCNGINRVVMLQNGNDKSLTLSGDSRTISIDATESKPDEYTTAWEGVAKILPSAGVEENALSAAFTCSAGKKVWQDEKYLDHETTEFSISFAPEIENMAEDDPFRSSYVEFQPVALAVSLDYRNNPHQANSAVQINLNVDAKLPDAELQAEMVLRITTQMAMQKLTTEDAEDLTMLSDERKEEILQQFVEGAVQAMAGLSSDELEELDPAEESDETEARPETTVVPPANATANE